MSDDQPTTYLPVRLPSGATIQIEATLLGGEEKASAGYFELDGVLAQIQELAGAFADSLRALKPDKVTVELGVEVGVEAGQLTALFVKGTGKTNLKIALEWAGD